MGALPLAFLNPWLLVALAGLPALYWLLRLMPPRPRRIDFPPLRILMDMVRTEETPARMPWWLVALRLGLAALVILALAGPILNPTPASTGARGPLVLLLDQGWPAAPDWERRLRAAEDAIGAAESAGRPVALVGLGERPDEIALAPAGRARERLRALAPQPFIPDRAAHLPMLKRVLDSEPRAELLWLSDGLDLGDARGFADSLATLAPGAALTVQVPERTARVLADPDNSPAALSARVLRAEGRAGEAGTVRAFDLRGRPLADAAYAFDGDTREATVTLDMPIELRNEVARLEIAGERSAGAVQLLDERWRRRAVGLVAGTTAETAQPLLSPVYYVSRALEPFADIRNPASGSPSEAVRRFVADGLPVIALADVGTLAGDARDELHGWVERGGVLVRFAGSRLAGAGTDDLVPVRLRRGGRVLGGALAWATPQPLGPFPETSPFAGLPASEDVTVNRQVLAEPDPDLAERTWAVLADGTPLVTAHREGRGLIVLFHVTADTTWSNLPISGLFVDMLRRIVALSGDSGVRPEGEAGGGTGAAAPAPSDGPALAPTRTLDGFGAFRSPPPTAKPVPSGAAPPASAEHPPGIYGPADGFVAVNAAAADMRPARLDLSGLPATVRGYASVDPLPLAPWLMAAAFVLLLIDSLILLWMSGALARVTRRGAVTGAAVLLAAAIALPPDAFAQTAAERFAMEATLSTRLAYVVTGDRNIDQTSLAGLKGLSRQLAARTAFVPGEPMGIDPSRDELAFFPLIYWPVSTNAEAPSADTLARIDTYMKRGGTILFDTRDALDAMPGQTPAGAQALRRILGGLDLPELEPAPQNHVLGRAFYLLNDFPGRYATGPLWVEALPAETEDESARPARSGDNVSPILITSNDFAGAWATDAANHPLYPTVPSDPRQREMAFRAGINIVIYALTGNYKADQVHVPALLERLGQ